MSVPLLRAILLALLCAACATARLEDPTAGAAEADADSPLPNAGSDAGQTPGPGEPDSAQEPDGVQPEQWPEQPGLDGLDAAAIFPLGIAVASPFEMVESDPEPGALTPEFTTAYARITGRIEALLDGRAPLDGAFHPAEFFQVGQTARCYGPTVMYRDHPDAGAGEPDDGALPSGDLGLWLELDPQTEDACAAAQLSASLTGVRDQTLSALMGLASLLVVAHREEQPLPEAGETLELTDEMAELGLAAVTWASASITRTEGGAWAYLMDFEYAPLGESRRVVVELTHRPGDRLSNNEGVLSYRLYGDDRDFPGGNCRQAERTFHGSLKYLREGERDVATQSRTAIFCGHDADGFVRDPGDPASGLVDPSQRYDPANNPAGWSEGFTTFVAELDPVSLSGSYALSWQAGVWDSHSRVFNVGINDNTPTDGEAYFGYGAPAWETDGSILGFICNWAGPGRDPSLQSYAQRQFTLLDPDSGRFLSVGADITYAPTNDCSYDGASSFVYDRDVDMDLTDENPVAAVTPDLLDTDVDDDGVPDVATIGEAIEARGYDLPVAPGGWPGHASAAAASPSPAAPRR